MGKLVCNLKLTNPQAKCIRMKCTVHIKVSRLTLYTTGQHCSQPCTCTQPCLVARLCSGKNGGLARLHFRWVLHRYQLQHACQGQIYHCASCLYASELSMHSRKNVILNITLILIFKTILLGCAPSIGLCDSSSVVRNFAGPYTCFILPGAAYRHNLSRS